ncbi:ParB/Srx family N-terminal domain-containing protein [Bacteroides sp. 51]|uniref:ParB/Srx family N-terminal domain-containing protein n=1 Tax=Bacteroides sp. 51 TaxID=2302938 RepID=UPI0013D79D6F|nr:ParB/Srx family N-terminal domain-containing protein [Bacteroides sp. 51]NDV83373.1 hypothetical protein [Bacteroides sp. 51]
MKQKEILFLEQTGKKVAFVKGNRGVNSKNLKQKAESIKLYGQLMPIMVVDATVALEEGLELVDARTGESIPKEKIEEYLVIIEGQHRYAAYLLLKELDAKNGSHVAPNDILIMYSPNPKSISIKKQISECNIVSVTWDGGDYITGAALCNPTSELLQYAKDLADLNLTSAGKGYPLSTISLITTFGDKLTKVVLAKSMEEGVSVLPTGDVERGRRFIKTARSVGFPDAFLKSRPLIEWFIDETNDSSVGLEGAFQKLESFTPVEVEKIRKVTTSNYLEIIRGILSAKL